MTIDALKDFFRQDARCGVLFDTIKHNENPNVHLKGVRGSAISFIVEALYSTLSGTHVLVFADKERAAYFYNDMQSLVGEDRAFFFPGSYRYPYKDERTDNTNVLMRAEVLEMLSKKHSKCVVVTYGEALTEKVVTKKNLRKNTLAIKKGDELSLDFVSELLQEYEFERVDFVGEPGQYAIRGGIVDVFSFAHDLPYRVEFFGDEVDSIRDFDPIDQLSKKNYQRINIVPNVQRKILEESREGFFEFLPNHSTLWFDQFEVSLEQVKMSYQKAEEAYAELSSETVRLPPNELFENADSIVKSIHRFPKISFGADHYGQADEEVHFKQRPQPTFNKKFDLLAQDLNKNSASQIQNVIVSNAAHQLERLHAIFEDQSRNVSYKPILLSIAEGFVDEDIKLALYTDHQIFERYKRFRLKDGFKRTKEALTIKELTSLQKGDYVTHIDHGIGVFDGLEKIDVNGKEQETIRLIYRDSDLLYVSIHSLHRIAKYSGKDGTEPKINKLGSPAWKNLKNKTKKKVKEIAYDLIKLYAKRKAQKGFQYTPDSYLQHELESSFIYEDTPDQAKATAAIKEDMESEAPMDRLICGDVGFGKTEIAIRAAFKAVANGKQVAVLVPTTILSYQHYKTFQKRLEDMPCTVDYINRFKSTKDQKATLNAVTEGKVDILIGTHRIVGKDVKFKDIGLLIIDEEQKFGVGVKDKLKTMKANVDTLTLTATPIPRTLQFSLMSARDLSVIKTAPPNRQPVQTVLRTFSEESIRDAVNYEISRDGQVFFVHNRIDTIREVQGMLQRLCPGVSIGVAHGQLEGHKLEETMMAFINHEFDILIATTIIESGLDIPNVNTIIINNAHNFGLSDLHQMRGRVGRSNKKAFCHLLSPPVATLPTESRKRLQAIEQFSELGSGFNIAMRDLDIRGAGNLLGAEQSGFMSDMGYDTYMKILKEAMDELKEQDEFKHLFEKEKEAENFVSETLIDTDMEIMIPDSYVSNIEERLSLYKSIGDIKSEEQLQRFERQLVDRFGPIPESTQRLLTALRLRWLGERIGFEKIVVKNQKMLCYFISNQDSAYFQSPFFVGLMQYINASRGKVQMKQRNEKLYLAFEKVTELPQAIELLEDMLVPEAV